MHPVPPLSAAEGAPSAGDATRGRWAWAALLAAPVLATAQPAAPAHEDGLDARAARLRLGYEKVSLPGREKMGLLGATYLVETLPQLSLGASVYGAISGDRGGLFTLGVEAAWEQPLWRALSLEAGLYVGGGGGASAPVGGGLMLRPHAGLLWDFGAWRAGLTYSHVKFPSGDISSSQWGLSWSLDTSFDIGRPRAAPAPGLALRSGLGFDRVFGVATVYLPPDGTLRRTGGTMNSRVGLVGARFDSFVTPSLYWGIEAAGAASGGAGGYAEVLATVGIERLVWGEALSVGARAALGMAGGGDVSTGGGALVKLGVHTALRLSPQLSLALEGGWVRAPQGDFRAPYAGLGLSLDIDHRGRPQARESTVRTEWITGIEQYQAARRDGSERALRNVVLKVNRYLGESVYITGQARSAYGGGAGGYTVGLIGVGWQGPISQRLSAGGEFVLGAGGGGGVDSAGGALIQPNAFLAVDLSSSWSARLGAGYVRSTNGRLSSPMWELSLGYAFGVRGQP